MWCKTDPTYETSITYIHTFGFQVPFVLLLPNPPSTFAHMFPPFLLLLLF